MRVSSLSNRSLRVESPKNARWEWFYAIIFAVVGATFIRWMVAALCFIPSSSMESTLLEGDFVLVSKFHYGARTPATPLQLPLTHRLIPRTNVPAYVDWIQLPVYRLPGLCKVRHNDVVVFNTPMDSGDHTPLDLRDYFVKRCVALPGDTIRISHKQLYVNETSVELYDKIQYHYFMKTKPRLSDTFFEKNGIKDYRAVKLLDQEGYALYTTPEKVKQLITNLPAYIQSVDPVEEEAGRDAYRRAMTFWGSAYTFFNWTKDNFGPLTVPKKGMKIPMDKQHILLYGETIAQFEGKKQVQFTTEGCLIDGQQIREYTFAKDYYFFMGDNRDRSQDSRMFGFVPQDHIVGKVIIVLFSADKKKGFWRGIRWNRLFQLVH